MNADSMLQCVPTAWWFMLQPQITLRCQLNEYSCKKHQSAASELAGVYTGCIVSRQTDGTRWSKLGARSGLFIAIYSRDNLRFQGYKI